MLGGAIIFGEFSDMELWRTLVYCLGVLILLCGVVFSSHRLRHNKLTRSFREVKEMDESDVSIDDDLAGVALEHLVLDEPST